jgi:hypothetical protein
MLFLVHVLSIYGGLKDTFLSCGMRTCTGVVLWSLDAASAGMYVCLQQSCLLLQCGSFQVAVGAQGRHSRCKVFENGSLSLTWHCSQAMAVGLQSWYQVNASRCVT